MIFANDEKTIINFRREIVSSFIKNGYEVLVCLPKDDDSYIIEELGCKVIDLAVSRHGTSIIQDFNLIKNCVSLIKKHRPDIVLTYTVKPNIYTSIACQKTRTPYINNVTGLGSVLQNKSALSTLILKLQKFAYRKSSCVFFQNESNLAELKKCGVISSKIKTVVIPGSGVNLQLQKYEEFPADDGVTRFVLVSRVREDKGFNEFFEAAKRVKEKYSNTEFHVIGWYEEDSYKETIDSLVEKNIIIYHGKKLQEEVHEIEKNCNCLIHPSYHEGMANVLLEAAATGRPVIASDIPGCRETFEDGVTGYSCKVKDADSLAEAIEKFINTPYEKQIEMGKLGREKMEKEFDRQIVVSKYLEVINQILEDKQNG